MSQTRRKTRTSVDSEEFSDGSGEENERIKGSEGESELDENVREAPHESEYESIEEEEVNSDEEQALVDEEGGQEALSDDVIIEEEIYESKREEGDGQESLPAKERKLDDDEDRRNPQYIPKRGTFYEHDDRTAVDEVEQPKKEEKKKKVWKENDDRWHHDKFNEADQAPKSKEELVAIYGYDIRNEDGPPRARRRRRYGRGPNKYTRNWEDEDAYSKPRGGGGGGRGGRGGGETRGSRRDRGNFPIRGRGGKRDIFDRREEEFPPLPNSGTSAIPLSSNDVKKHMEVTRSASEPKEILETTPQTEERTEQHAVRKEQVVEKSVEVVSNSVKSQEFSRSGAEPDKRERETQTDPPIARRGRGGGVSGFPRGRGRGRGGLTDPRGRGGGRLQERRSLSETRMSNREVPSVPVTSRKADDDLSRDMKKLSFKETDQVMNKDFRRQTKSTSNYHQSQERRQNVVPPRMQDGAANRPKRYSSQRQRSLPETPATNYGQPGSYYEPGYQQNVYAESPQQASAQPTVTPSPSQMISQPTFAPPFPSPPSFNESPAFLPRAQPPPPGPRLFTPVSVAQPPVPNPVVPAAPYISPNASVISYGPPTQFPPAPYPPFQGFPPVAPAQPQPPPEVYQNGITYYNTQNQVVSRVTPQKRPKVAIPIVPPPEKEEFKVKGKGRGREMSNSEYQPDGSMHIGGLAGEVTDEGGGGDHTEVPCAPPPVVVSNDTSIGDTNVVAEGTQESTATINTEECTEAQPVAEVAA